MKKIKLLVVFFMTYVTSYGQLPWYVPPTDLQIYWQCDTLNQYIDGSTFGRNGNPLFPPLFWPNRCFDPKGATLFNPTTTDQVQSINPFVTHFNNGQTISVWIQLDNYIVPGDVFQYGPYQISIDISSNFIDYTDGTNSVQLSLPGWATWIGKWINYMVVSDNTGIKQYMYSSGGSSYALLYSDSVSMQQYMPPVNDFVHLGGNPFVGRLYGIAMYNTGLGYWGRDSLLQCLPVPCPTCPCPTCSYPQTNEVEQQIVKEISMYPNPANDYINVTNVDKVSIYNQLGVLIKTSTDSKIYIGDMPDGVYDIDIDGRIDRLVVLHQ